MKNLIKNKIWQSILIATLILFATSCNDFLDRTPLDKVTPEDYFTSEDHLAAYTVAAYGVFPSHGAGSFGIGGFITRDHHTDDMVTTNPSTTRWAKGEWRVPESDGAYSFSTIRNANFFFERVWPLHKAGAIAGTSANIEHYIGEMYAIRAMEYFNKLKTFGDFPIVKNTLPDDNQTLIDASKRKPRNEVARFIIQDLDSAILLMKDDFKGKRRLTKNTAKLIKSRVALYEASWLTYHRGTPRVPGERGWPGASVDYNKGFTVDIDKEIDYFLTEAMSSADDIASSITLTENSQVYNPDANPDGWNPYFDMFSAIDMSKYNEILMWRAYDRGLNILHSVGVYIRGGANTGLTRGLVDSYLMKDGVPIYASNNYQGDETIIKLKENRDSRLQLFLFDEDTRWIMTGDPTKPRSVLFNQPRILEQTETRDVSGYRQRKYYNYDPIQSPQSGVECSYGSITFRAAEAYLNYIEACYMKTGRLDGKATSYWKALRQRAGVDENFQKTISMTDLSKENDWAVYSGGKQIDQTLYNIRRERRNELISEGMRWDDLKRWRALDQIVNYIPEGFNLWDKAYDSDDYKDVDNTGQTFSRLIEPSDAGAGKTANVSSRTVSKYLRPYQIIVANNLVFNGYNWSKANYLSPLPAYQIRLTSSNVSDPSTSPLYQNPYWPTNSGESALE